MIEIRRIDHGPFAFSLTTDASELGWGAVFETLGEEGVQLSTGGQWNLEEKREHINVLELKAALLGIRTFCTECDSTHVKVHMDNTTAIAYINHMGGVTFAPGGVMRLLKNFGNSADYIICGLQRHTYRVT